jgi:hypothetical protein
MKQHDTILLKEYVQLTLERKIREVDITSGKTQFGSKEHIEDLESRIMSLVPWRDKSPRGTANRENYSRLISRLKAELKSAKLHFEKTNELNS